MPHAYYNEIDAFCCAWLSNLMDDGLITPGDIDDRSIEDVVPRELTKYTRCHFFAGIGIWDIALTLAGWQDHPVWTGSCPCQPFSAAGKGGGFTDERHLWPSFQWLIRQCRPAVVFGEQVASKNGLAWLDLVQDDLEGEDYTVWPVDICAAGYGAPHIRQRLYWVAEYAGEGLEGSARKSLQVGMSRPASVRRVDGMAVAEHAERRTLGEHRKDGRDGQDGGRKEAYRKSGTCGQIRGLADIAIPGRDKGSQNGTWCPERISAEGRSAGFGLRGASGRSSPTNGLWRAADWLYCRDDKWRPVEPATFPLAPTGTFSNRVAELRGAGNSINLAQAAGFIEAVMGLMNPLP
jgi:DNA (cytosine-5)-methyltransferase 1